MAPEALFSTVDRKQLDEFIKLREIEGLSDSWVYHIKNFILDYLDYIKWKINKEKTLDYFTLLKKKHSTTTYRKRVYQIRKFLSYLGTEWADQINPPPEPEYLPKRLPPDIIVKTLNHFEKHEYFKQIKALIMLGASSGMRAEELYQLRLEDIDIKNNIIHINHNPNNNQTTKTKKSRISFFNEEAKQSILDYLPLFHEDKRLTCLFSQSHMERMFRDAPIRVKELRKFFSQEWDRRGGSTGIKKIIMGHSLKGDVDLIHYNYQSDEDLKQIYDKVNIKIT